MVWRLHYAYWPDGLCNDLTHCLVFLLCVAGWNMSVIYCRLKLFRLYHCCFLTFIISYKYIQFILEISTWVLFSGSSWPCLSHVELRILTLSAPASACGVLSRYNLNLTFIDMNAIISYNNKHFIFQSIF